MASEKKKLSEKQQEVLRKNRFTSEQSRDAAARNGSKGGTTCAKNKSLRKLGLQMLDAVPEVNESTLKQLKQLGLETEAPDMKTLILGRIFALAMSKDAKIAMQAAQMVLEITGNDVRSINASEQREIEREHLALEKEKLERTTAQKTEASRGLVDEILKAVGDIE